MELWVCAYVCLCVGKRDGIVVGGGYAIIIRQLKCLDRMGCPYLIYIGIDNAGGDLV